jgi:transposase
MKWGGYRSATAKKKAIVVVAHAMIVIIWHILATGKPYHELGTDYFTRRLDPEREPAGSSPSSKPSDTP